MVGLVDYEGSSDSEVDELLFDSSQILTKSNPSDTNHLNLFAKLPPPKINDEALVEETDEFLNKKAEGVEKPPKRIKINVPELSNLAEDVDIGVTPMKENKKKCGLFSILPSPKVAPLTNTCFVPKSLQQRSVKSSSKPCRNLSKIPNTHEMEDVSQAAKVETIKRVALDSDSETEDIDHVSPIMYDDTTWKELFIKKKKKIALPKTKETPAQQANEGCIVIAPETEKPYIGLDNLAFKELVGNKNKATKSSMIEVEEAKIHPEREDWLKSLTDPNFEASPLIKEPVNRTSLVKNHITSLAERALANEKDLQIRWSESRHSRMQTRTKYGF